MSSRGVCIYMRLPDIVNVRSHGGIASGARVIGDPAPPRIWHPRVKSPRDFGTSSISVFSIPHRTENSAPHAKFPREFGVPMLEKELSHKCSTLALVRLFVAAAATASLCDPPKISRFNPLQRMI